MKTLTKLILSLTVVLFFSCNGKQSLQEYYVDNQDNENFLSLDLPSSLLMVNDNMTKEQQETLSTVKKVNVLAFPKKEENTVAFKEEKAKINSILKDDKFHVLMKFNQNGMNAKVLYLGEEDAIDEIIIYGEDYEKGFGVARVLGNQMNPQKLIEMLKTVDNDMINVEGFEDIAKSFNNN
ncbi:DUF4252 domain-containing protein [Croceibacter atlanticus]|uniref:DUF4252 domain-containing protein n=1 Tax=Croceibacter atlanticus TaxID=313588 RepID=UPI002E132618|nr:DUF4252 domain-containing protein [Croceibacter atlanticus]|tara:strand:+ start:4020 stop:4559 length:540 start_codon:yes stop_codon:yes gene_type:complete